MDGYMLLVIGAFVAWGAIVVIMYLIGRRARRKKQGVMAALACWRGLLDRLKKANERIGLASRELLANPAIAVGRSHEFIALTEEVAAVGNLLDRWRKAWKVADRAIDNKEWKRAEALLVKPMAELRLTVEAYEREADRWATMADEALPVERTN